MPKKKSKKIKKNGKSVGGKADVHAHEEGKRNKSLLGHNAGAHTITAATALGVHGHGVGGGLWEPGRWDRGDDLWETGWEQARWEVGH